MHSFLTAEVIKNMAIDWIRGGKERRKLKKQVKAINKKWVEYADGDDD